jgi:hypothetical protein
VDDAVVDDADFTLVVVAGTEVGAVCGSVVEGSVVDGSRVGVVRDVVVSGTVT